MNKSNNNKGKLWSALIVGFIFVIILVLLFNTGNSSKRIDLEEFNDLVQNTQYYNEGNLVDYVEEKGVIYCIDIYDYTVRVYMSEKSYKDGNPDYYFNFQYEHQHSEISQKCETAGIIIKSTQWKGESWLSNILPYIYIAIIVVLGFFIIRTFMGKGNNGMGFARSKARLVISSKVKFADVAGADEEKLELMELVDFFKDASRFAELGARIPKGVLLVGPPGTGKTLLAKAVAGEANVPFFSISGSDFVELYVGVGASRVRDLFEQAKKNAPCIVFIDEIDAVGRQRGAGMGGGNDEREQTLNQLLVEMDGFESNSGIIVLAATNRADILDPALTRPGRFDRQIYVRLPDVKGREEILKIHSKNKPLSDDVDLKRVARLTSGFAGADIENMLNEAALLAARDNRVKITMIDITEGINKVIMGPKKKSLLVTEEDKVITAYHEGGHAIVARALPNCDHVQEISIIPRGMAAGYTLTLDEKDEQHMTKSKLLDTITMMLGGRVAEEIMCNDITTGASNDLERATKYARKMVAEWGMSDKFGLVSYGEGGEIFVGRDYQKQQAYSSDVATKIDAEIKNIIEQAHSRAKEILKDKKDLLENLKILLLERETIFSEEFEELYNGANVQDVLNKIDEKEKEKKEYHEKARNEAKVAKLEKSLQNRLDTATAYHKAKMMSDAEYETIKKEIEEEMLKLSSEKTSAKSQNEQDNNNLSDNDKKQNLDEDIKGQNTNKEQNTDDDNKSSNENSDKKD